MESWSSRSQPCISIPCTPFGLISILHVRNNPRLRRCLLFSSEISLRTFPLNNLRFRCKISRKIRNLNISFRHSGLLRHCRRWEMENLSRVDVVGQFSRLSQIDWRIEMNIFLIYFSLCMHEMCILEEYIYDEYV